MTEIEEIERLILEYNPKADLRLIEKAYNFAKNIAHEGQLRETGEPYVQHPIEVAKILIGLKVQSSTVAAAFLHDTVEESPVTLKRIKQEFGTEIAGLVEGVTKIDKVHFESKDDYTAENLRKILLATAKDMRIMLIKLADRLHNMRTLKAVKPQKQERIAAETLSIYAPIAHKLGMWQMKGELEDLSLRYLEPEVYQKLRDRINEKRSERDEKTREFIDIIRKKLEAKGISADVVGRAKFFYSIYKKMKRKNVDFSEIYDLIAIRIITRTIPDCYAALGIVHDTWKPIPKKFKDYIATPKANGYQSLHTAVVGSHGKILEVQIRTEEMHQIAEDGIAAHWRYKGTERDKRFDRKIAWIKQVLEWRQTAEDARDFIETLKIDLFEKEIIVFTPKGDPVSLPDNSTPVDFAYEIHSTVGNTCSKVLVNEKLVPLDTVLSAGDVVQIVTQKNARPSRQWLKFVKTSKARSKIRQALKIESDADSKVRADEDQPERNYSSLVVPDRNIQVKLGKCCDPRPGDDIVAYITKDGKATVHKAACPNAAVPESVRRVGVAWQRMPEKLVVLQLLVKDRVGILSDILARIAAMKLNIRKLYTEAGKHGRIAVNLQIEYPQDDPAPLIGELRQIHDVISVMQLKD